MYSGMKWQVIVASKWFKILLFGRKVTQSLLLHQELSCSCSNWGFGPVILCHINFMCMCVCRSHHMCVPDLWEWVLTSGTNLRRTKKKLRIHSSQLICKHVCSQPSRRMNCDLYRVCACVHNFECNFLVNMHAGTDTHFTWHDNMEHAFSCQFSVCLTKSF